MAVYSSAFVNGGSNWLTSATSPVSTYPFTLAGWARLDDLTNNPNLFTVVGASTDCGIQVQTTTGKIITYASNAGADSTISTTALTAGVWGHFCGVFASATDRRSFCNGAGKATSSVNKALSSMTRVNLGAWANSGVAGGGFGIPKGAYAEMGLWNVALADEEVAALAAGVSPLRIRTANLQGYWPLYAASFPAANRVSGSYAVSLVGGTLTTVSHPPVGSPFGSHDWPSYAVAAAPSGTLLWHLRRMSGGFQEMDIS